MSRDAFQCISETVSEGPDRETETPFYARFVQWNSALTPPNDHGNYAWVPYTREPNHLMSSISTKRNQGWNQFGTSEDRETEMEYKPSQTVDVDSDVQMTMEPIAEKNPATSQLNPRTVCYVTTLLAMTITMRNLIQWTPFKSLMLDQLQIFAKSPIRMTLRKG